MLFRLTLIGAGAIAVLCAAPALAQQTEHSVPPGSPTPSTAPDGHSPGDVSTTTNGPTGERGPGIGGARAVNPAPGAGDHPYVGHSEGAFYDVEHRIARVEQRAQSLRGAQRRKALSGIKSIKAELATQEARHGEVRDWDREHLNKRLDALEDQVGMPRANTVASAPG
jgi:hypothetical protein